MAEIPTIPAMELMLQAATASISANYTFYDYLQEPEFDSLPAVIVNPVESQTNFEIYVIQGVLLLQLIALADPAKTHRENIKEHSERAWELVRALQLLPYSSGYLIYPKYQIKPAERIGESAEVVNNSDILEAQILVSFGLTEG